MRKILDFLYDGALFLAAFFMIATLAMVLSGVLGRLFNFNLAGSAAYAGYSVAAASFLALAHTLKRGEHIRVTLVLQHVKAKTRRALELACTVVAVILTFGLAWFSVRLAWQSYELNDISQNTDLTPLWIPQMSMAVGTTVLFIAFVDDLVTLLSGRSVQRPVGELAQLE